MTVLLSFSRHQTTRPQFSSLSGFLIGERGFYHYTLLQYVYPVNFAFAKHLYALCHFVSCEFGYLFNYALLSLIIQLRGILNLWYWFLLIFRQKYLAYVALNTEIFFSTWICPRALKFLSPRECRGCYENEDLRLRPGMPVQILVSWLPRLVDL